MHKFSIYLRLAQLVTLSAGLLLTRGIATAQGCSGISCGTNNQCCCDVDYLCCSVGNSCQCVPPGGGGCNGQ